MCEEEALFFFATISLQLPLMLSYSGLYDFTLASQLWEGNEINVGHQSITSIV